MPKTRQAASIRGLRSQERRRSLFIALGATLAVLGLIFLTLRLVPYAGDSALENLRFSSKLSARDGTELAILPINEEGLRRLFAPAEELPEELFRIVLAAEDSRFFFHAGVDLLALGQAAWGYLQGNDIRRGASTISMQLSSMLYTRPTTPFGKLQEIVDALQLETRLSKQEILELYISMVPMGFNVEGYPAAARRFFGRQLSQLSAQELAILAAIPRSPGRFNPLANPAAAYQAATSILHAAGMAASQVPPESLAYTQTSSWPNEAPHFVNYLVQKGEHLQANGRETLVTSIDINLQHLVEAELRATMRSASNFRISNAAAIFANPVSGEILAYAGSVDFLDVEAQGQIDGVQIRRQPGSTLKPFLAALALENGFTLASVLPDIQLSFGGSQVYVPENFNERFHGPVRLREALSASLNVPAVYLLERLSVAGFVDALVASGFSGLDNQRDSLGVSLALGGAEVSLFELLGAYLGFHSDGLRPALRWLAGSSEEKIRAWEPSTAALIRSVLTDNDERIMTFGRVSPLKYNSPVMVKTGTSNQFNNIWAVGVAQDLAGAVWMGNFSGETVQSAPGSSLPAGALHAILEEHTAGNPFIRNGSLREAWICSLSGMLATDNCNHSIHEFFTPNSLPAACDWHHAEHGGRAQYPQLYGFWAQDQGYDILLKESGPTDIFGITDKGIYYADPLLPASVQQSIVYITGESPGTVRLDGRTLYSGELPVRIAVGLEPGSHALEAESASGRDFVQYEVR